MDGGSVFVEVCREVVVFCPFRRRGDEQKPAGLVDSEAVPGAGGNDGSVSGFEGFGGLTATVIREEFDATVQDDGELVAVGVAFPVRPGPRVVEGGEDVTRTELGPGSVGPEVARRLVVLEGPDAVEMQCAGVKLESEGHAGMLPAGGRLG